MEMNVEKLIEESYKVFPHTDKRIEVEKKRKSNLDFDNYLDYLDDKFYELINEMIICLQSERMLEQQRAEISKQLIGMFNFHFNEFPNHLKSSKTTFSRWRFFIGTTFQSVENKNIYIKPNDFTKDYISSILNRLQKLDLILLDSIHKPKDEKFPWTKYEKEAWFRVAVEYAKGEVDRLKKMKRKDTDIAKVLFPDVPTKNPEEKGYKYSLGALRTIIGNSYNNDFSKQKHILGRDKEELQAVVDFCQYHKFEIKDSRFIEHLNIQKINKN